MRKVIWGVLKRWPTAEAMAEAEEAELSALIVQLGFGQKRAAMLKRFSLEYATKDVRSRPLHRPPGFKVLKLKVYVQS